MTGLARRLRCTDGQLYTAVIGCTVAVALLLIGIPPVFREQPVAAGPTEVAAAPAPPDGGVPPATGPAAPADADVGAVAMPRFSPAAGAAVPPAASPSPGLASPRSAAPAPPETVIETPLAVVDSGYTSSTSGTPLSGPEVPDDGMPVGVRLGRVDKMSFARLAGSGTLLHLRLVDDPLANQLVALAAVRACAITDPAWSLDEPGAPPEDAPPFDGRRCVDGAQSPSGTWTFDLDAIGALDGTAGIALVPVSEGPATFQVTFSDVALTPEEV